MGVIAGLVVGVVVGMISVAAICRHDFIRMAQFLRDRPAAGNARLTVAIPTHASRELASAINEQLDAIQSERIQSIIESQQFRRDLSALAHDVRTPLMGAQGHIQLALESERTSVEACRERNRHLEVSLKRLHDVKELLDQLFAYARANDPDHTLDIGSVALQPLLAEILVAHYPQFEARHWAPDVKFEDESFAVEADRAACMRIIDNLVVNVLRHGAGAPVIVQHGDTITFSNAIDDETASHLDPSRLFDRFYQADETRGGNGSGLGLAVAQSLAHSMALNLSATVDSAGCGPASLSITLGPETS
jgi:signal transduction histidine kinase